MTSIRDFIPLSKLGEGTFSTVYKVRRISDQQVYALKKVRMTNLSTKEKENALNEVRILASIESQHIVAYKQAFFDQKLNLLCIVMEYADGGDLHKLIKQQHHQIPQSSIWRAASDILQALFVLHSKGILHRDLKCANIFLQNGKYKVGDLNVSKVNGGNLAYTQTGTPYYASPQVWRDQPYDSKSDLWSFGCIIYQMTTLRPPFEGRDMNDLFKSIQNKNYTPLSENRSKQLHLLIKLCLQKNPLNRKSALQLLSNANFSQLLNFKDAISQQPAKPKQLLKTIKLPSDMKSLHQNLPSSKYSSYKHVKTQIQNNYVSDRPRISNSIGQQKNNSQIYSNASQNISYNNPYISPRRHKKTQISNYLLKSPSIVKTPIKIIQKNISPNYSERPYYRDIKVNNSDHKINSIPQQIISDYIKENVKKRPITSMPRTQKRSIVNNLQSNLYGREILDDLRKKLIKKNRVVSYNSPKPSWWG